MNDPHNQERSIFLEAIELGSAAEQVAFLDEACGADVDMRQKVEALLHAHGQSGDIFDRSAVAVTIATTEIDEQVGSSIGPYKLREKLGEGGMGIVYVAEQEEPVRRKVALKIIKPGMDTRDVVGRFEAERQALALMDHPNIAHVLDAGATEAGRPYFVMELVPGMPVTEYCNKYRLPTHTRLELFVKICQAVQHAHQKGIIHRDIKPSNVMITLHDGEPVPKVIDFGVAKATGRRLTDRTVYTQVSQIVGTPLYMSPEQADLSGLDVDTRTDIYSLGVLLYELLTGTTPFAQQQLSEVGYDEMRRIIREEEPLRPSQRISTLNAEALSTISNQRSGDPRRLTQLVRGELDWIAMKALEKDRTRRYDSASAFAADVRNYLNDEPVAACPPSFAYKFGKFARRNKVALTMASLATVALLVGIVGLAVGNVLIAQQRNAAQTAQQNENKQRLEAEQQKEIAERQRAEAQRQKKVAEENFQRAREAVDTYLTKVSEDKLLNAPSLQPLREELLELALRYYQKFIEQRSGDPSVRAELAHAYHRVGDLTRQIGSRQQAFQAHLEALRIREQLTSAAPAELDYQVDLASSHREVGKLFGDFGEKDKALSHFRQSIRLYEGLAGASPDVADYQLGLSEAYSSLGSFLLGIEDTKRAITWYEKALRIAERLVEQSPDVPDYQIRLAWAYSALAIVKPKEGLILDQEAININEKLVDQYPENLAYQDALAASYNNTAVHTNDISEKIALFQRAISIMTRLAEQNPDVIEYQRWLANYYCNLARHRNNPDGKIEPYQNAISIHENIVRQNPDVLVYQKQLADLQFELGGVQRRRRMIPEANDLDRRSISALEKLVEENPELAALRINLISKCLAHGQRRSKDGDHEAAAASWQKVVDIVQPRQKRFAADWGYLGRALYFLSRWQEARAALEKGIEIRGDEGPTITKGPRWWYLTMTLNQLGETERARAYYDQLVDAIYERIDRGVNVSEDALRHRRKAAQLLGKDDEREFAQKELALRMAKPVEERTYTDWRRSGDLHYRAGQWQNAKHAYEKAIELRGETQPSLHINWWTLTKILCHLGETEKARSYYEQLVQQLENRPAGLREQYSRSRAEAAQLLGITDVSNFHDEKPESKGKNETGSEAKDRRQTAQPGSSNSKDANPQGEQSKDN